MFTHPCKPMAYRLLEGTGIKQRLVQRSARRQALGALLGGLFLLSLGSAQPAQAQGEVTFSAASLRGSYSYSNFVENVGSLGLITFDGKGALNAQIKVNTPSTSGGRTITPESGSGTYTVDPTGTGVATIQFTTLTATYDFVITKVAERRRNDQPLAQQVFAVDRAGGLAGQLVAPFWNRISD
ncbi:MAG: hypothetical protein JO110_12815 [Acetobacteraceae bacterium]|nr:hypothetical protein [Acetobacteraceae bacterium]